MKRRKAASPKSPLIRLVGLEAAVAATGLAGCLTAFAAPGDLDPSFGDAGRQSNIALPSYYSNLWSVDVLADDAVLFGGGGEYEYYATYEDDFVGRLLPNGTFDTSFVAAALANTVVYDTAPQPDGKVIGVGTVGLPDGKRKLLVFRLRPDGSLDPDFGLGGQAIISDGSPSREAGYSVVVDPDGRIAVAGQRGSNLLVARLLPNGTLDAGFGAAGVFVGRELVGNLIRIAGVPGGAYRVAVNYRVQANYNGCGVAGLTSAGALDAAFGSGGYAPLQYPDYAEFWCRSLAVQPDGRLLLGGTVSGVDGYIGRLLANGAPDPSFSAGEVDSRFRSVSALAVSPGGTKIFVAGEERNGYSGALIVRLLVDGTRDTTFGRDGATTVDLKSRRTHSAPTINDMKVTTGGGLVVGGDANNPYGTNAFVARLLGDTAGGGPGVLGLKQSRMLATEQGGQIVLAVQRTGGSSGPVAVTYATRDVPVPPAPGPAYSLGASANGGVDYTSMTGRLTWADGEVGDREIVVPIATDTNAEPPEFFEVVLESPEGGAGLATFGSDLEIAGAGYPSGDFTIQAEGATVSEGTQAAFSVHRNYYSQGAVSVTVRVAAGGSATQGQDFRAPGRTDWQDVVVTWANGEYGSRSLSISVVADGTAEPIEAFTLELASPTGGAVLGATTQATVQITDRPPPPPPPPPAAGGGGGNFGSLGALLLALGGALRRRRIRNR